MRITFACVESYKNYKTSTLDFNFVKWYSNQNRKINCTYDAFDFLESLGHLEIVCMFTYRLGINVIRNNILRRSNKYETDKIFGNNIPDDGSTEFIINYKGKIIRFVDISTFYTGMSLSVSLLHINHDEIQPFPYEVYNFIRNARTSIESKDTIINYFNNNTITCIDMYQVIDEYNKFFNDNIVDYPMIKKMINIHSNSKVNSIELLVQYSINNFNRMLSIDNYLSYITNTYTSNMNTFPLTTINGDVKFNNQSCDIDCSDTPVFANGIKISYIYNLPDYNSKEITDIIQYKDPNSYSIGLFTFNKKNLNIFKNSNITIPFRLETGELVNGYTKKRFYLDNITYSMFNPDALSFHRGFSWKLNSKHDMVKVINKIISNEKSDINLVNYITCKSVKVVKRRGSNVAINIPWKNTPIISSYLYALKNRLYYNCVSNGKCILKHNDTFFRTSRSEFIGYRGVSFKIVNHTIVSDTRPTIMYRVNKYNLCKSCRSYTSMNINKLYITNNKIIILASKICRCNNSMNVIFYYNMNTHSIIDIMNIHDRIKYESPTLDIETNSIKYSDLYKSEISTVYDKIKDIVSSDDEKYNIPKLFIYFDSMAKVKILRNKSIK